MSAKYQFGLTFRKTCGSEKCISTEAKSKRHTEKSKSKLRKKRLDFMQANPEKTAWRKSNISYPEQLFLSMIKNYELDKKYCIIREKCFFPYYVDFYFENIMLAIEIDGSQHNTKENKIKDHIKDQLLKNNGCTVIRITANSLIKDYKKTVDTFLKILNSDTKQNNENIQIGIFKNTEYQEKIKAEKKLEKEKEKERKLEILRKKIRNSNIDFSKQKWVPHVSVILKISHGKVTNWMRKNMNQFWIDNCFKRKGTLIKARSANG